MRALRLGHPSPLPAAIDIEAPQPAPGSDELLIRVHAAGVTPTEIDWYPTTHTKTGQTRTHAVPGHEFSGVVAAAGSNLSDFRIGQVVYGMNDWFDDGATADYCLTSPQSIAPRPANLTHAEAAAVPIGALTAWQGLFDRARLQPGERVLIHGGSGAVGVFAVQLAHGHGAFVIASASAPNLDLITHLGADQAIDYRAQRFEDAARGVDIVFDTVGGDTLNRSWNVLSPRGRVVTIAAGGDSTNDDRVKQAFFIVEPNHDQLSHVSDLITAGRLRPIVDTVVPFEQVPDTYAGTTKRTGRGKVVVAVISE